ncbi:MAG: hypothetical protein AVDCRST_MAG76-1159, partial [uncultured Acidimicrobiales bacterium]
WARLTRAVRRSGLRTSNRFSSLTIGSSSRFICCGQSHGLSWRRWLLVRPPTGTTSWLTPPLATSPSCSASMLRRRRLRFAFSASAASSSCVLLRARLAGSACRPMPWATSWASVFVRGRLRRTRSHRIWRIGSRPGVAADPTPARWHPLSYAALRPRRPWAGRGRRAPCTSAWRVTG